jgi:hypothetical protein
MNQTDLRHTSIDRKFHFLSKEGRNKEEERRKKEGLAQLAAQAVADFAIDTLLGHDAVMLSCCHAVDE